MTETPRYDVAVIGFLAARKPAVGWQLPQPWVIDSKGATVRLDDVLGGQWAIVHNGSAPAGAAAWTELGVPTFRIGGPSAPTDSEAIRNAGGTLVAWLKDKKAAAVVIRPDGFVYAASEPGELLQPPPAGLTPCSPPAPAEPITSGASA